MLANVGVSSLILVVIIAFIIFGSSKLPEIGKAFGSTLKECKSASSIMMKEGF
ncbi:twin-arginine translocase TatA/TatE family subunit [Halalkalibacter alkaliphilus]|uniref:Twin-arginine translocase TatA/TatE family subunit n=1 Tax=Halalkalibacter alkaliphilus TaxID=2917993 RepID=A0A9X2I478_9BACI|nr:twin-arginine translocase TatA/TatE family subunit [Halalkalibacter alkaliphilus]MCL7747682.1 twin-arginine translocase TatA/TatE family subunit [Halalkalibacter alkaliphilus]